MSNGKYANDIFAVLSAIDKKNISYFDSLTEKELKDISPYVLMKWLAGTSDPYQVYVLNEIINTRVFNLQKHKELLIALLTVCTDGKSKRYKWMKSKTVSNYGNCISVIKDYFNYNTKDAKEAFNILTEQDILLYADHLGRQDDELTKIRKELKQRKNE